MRQCQLLYTVTHVKSLLAAIVVGGIEVLFLPNPQLIFYLLGAMVVDLLTGLLKSWDSGVATTSTGFRKTVIKLGVYSCVILATWLLANLLSSIYGKLDYAPMVNMVIGFLSFIELYSVFENIYAMAPNSALSRYIAKPFLKFLKGLLDRADQNLNSNDPDNDNKPS